MKTPLITRPLSPAVRRRLELAIAVAQERLLATHVDHALELIEIVGDRVPFDEALALYHRLLRLPPDDAHTVTTRALARIGEAAAEAEFWPVLMGRVEPPPPPEPEEGQRKARGLLGSVRRRLRGRVDDDLRRWIELVAARTGVALLETHTENALHFVEVLAGEVPFGEAVQLYLDALDVDEGIAKVVYDMALARLSEKLLPPRKALPRVAPAAVASDERHLRVVEPQAAG